MFALSQEEQEVSPHCMRFKNWWIYDLRIFNEFWQNKIQQRSNLILEKTTWQGILRAYEIQVFSPLSSLELLAQDYFDQFRILISKRQIQKVFQHFYRLGLQRVGNLRKIPFAEIQKRFGKDWHDFFKGVLEPQDSLWRWEAFRKPQILEALRYSEDSLYEASRIKELVQVILEKWGQQHPWLGIERLEIHLGAEREEGDRQIEILFAHLPSFDRDRSWMMRVIEERLSNLSLEAPIQKIQIRAFPREKRRQIQLSLFQESTRGLQVQELCERLRTQGFQAFQPKLLPSQIPEESWQKDILSSESLRLQETHELRPLIQYPPKVIPEPHGKLYFTERLQWFDVQGHTHRRDYYLWYSTQRWLWIFRNEEDQWFEQGIAE